MAVCNHLRIFFSIWAIFKNICVFTAVGGMKGRHQPHNTTRFWRLRTEDFNEPGMNTWQSTPCMMQGMMLRWAQQRSLTYQKLIRFLSKGKNKKDVGLNQQLSKCFKHRIYFIWLILYNLLFNHLFPSFIQMWHAM